MIRTGLLAAISAATIAVASGVASAHSDAATTGSEVLPHFQTDADGEKKPFTDVDFKNEAKDFQFIVMSDRNGANRAGVFEDAIKKINWLQPEFVISVGDLIGGYKTDMKEIEGQREEFDGIIKQLNMRYFYVPGNHDLSNPGQERTWEERYGHRYYHFLYHDVLFLVLSTDDPFPVQMGDEQVAYFEKVLKDNPSPRWTMVFMHNPTWRLDPTKHQASKKKAYENRFSDFDRMLKDRKYTVFAGHTHNYTHARRNGGHEHIVMATTGGGSKMRGARNYGEFDHMAWVTMTDNGPIIANLDLDGILPPDVRTSETAAQVSQMERARPTSEMVKVERDIFTTGEAKISVKNPLQIPIEVSFDFEVPTPLTVDPKSVTRELEPGAKTDIKVSLRAPAPEPIA
jgi:predicted phosphodiesterase